MCNTSWELNSRGREDETVTCSRNHHRHLVRSRGGSSWQFKWRQRGGDMKWISCKRLIHTRLCCHSQSLFCVCFLHSGSPGYDSRLKQLIGSNAKSLTCRWIILINKMKKKFQRNRRSGVSPARGLFLSFSFSFFFSWVSNFEDPT